PQALRDRIVANEAGPAFLIAREEETDIRGPILLTQRDVREVQLAKGAIAAGTNMLLAELGATVNDLHTVLLAGAFGNFIRRNMAKRIGLLPDLPTDRIQFVGNAAGAGARMALLSRASRQEAIRASNVTCYIELAGRP
ncbi:MAG TPA: ASKHA domain-containing protein, partial [Candidatus Brocadiia bacterium]|nr:ASKHA domain-containing protein [Candidatus Brocadiia bacterium]